MPDLAAGFRRPFAEQLAAFRLRLGTLASTARWDDLWQGEHDRAFMVAGAMKADLLADLGLAVDRAIAEGTSLESFRQDFRGIVEKHGWHGWTGEGTAKGEAWRTRVIYRTNMATSYAAGRHAQLVAGGFAFWVYKHSGAAHPRLDHLSWDGVVLEADHPFWAAHFPPNGWGCGCKVFGARSKDSARRVGGKPGKELPDNWNQIDPKTGAPVGIGKGWAYAPGASVAETVALGAQKIATLPARIGSDLGTGMADIIDRSWPMWVADIEARGSHEPGLAGVLGHDLIEALAAGGRAPVSAEIMVKPGLLVGPKALRHEFAGDALTSEQWVRLPALLRQPRAAMIDNRTGKLILLLGAPDRGAQVAVSLDYFVKKPTKGLINLVISAYRPELGALRNRLAADMLQLLLGKIG